MEIFESIGLTIPPWGLPLSEGWSGHASPSPACRAPAIRRKKRWSWRLARRSGLRLVGSLWEKPPLRAPAMHHVGPVHVAPPSCRAVGHPLCGLQPWRWGENGGASDAARRERLRSCPTLSDHRGMARGRLPPLGLSLRTRRGGVQRHVSWRIASMSVALFSMDRPSTVSAVMPGVIAPALRDSVAYERRDRAG
jgi:hypothetical protein